MDHMHEALKRKYQLLKEKQHGMVEGMPGEEAGESLEEQKKEHQEGTELAPSLPVGDAISGKGSQLDEILAALADGGSSGKHQGKVGGLHSRAADAAKEKMASIMKHKKGF